MLLTLPEDAPVQVRLPMPVPLIVIVPFAMPHAVGLTSVPIEIVGIANGAAVPEPAKLVQPPEV